VNYQVHVRPRARIDVNRSVAWISEHVSVRSADRWLATFESSIDDLANKPDRYASTSETLTAEIEIRERLFGRKPHVYRILFVILNDTVQVLRFRHAAQDQLIESDLGI
jgi:plasmid stabilization system protein ParE